METPMWTNDDYVSLAENVISGSLDDEGRVSWHRRVAGFISDNFADTPEQPDPALLLNAVEGMMVQFARV